MKLDIPKGQKFSCQQCTKCCQDWFVALTKKDLIKLKAQSWLNEAEFANGYTINIQGHPYLSHKENGSCLFLNEQTGHCKIHDKFGEKEKPLGCKVFPFNIASTFDDSISITGRFSCPSVRRNTGEDYGKQTKTIQNYISEMSLNKSFTVNDTAKIQFKTVEYLTHFLRNSLQEINDSAKKALFLLYFTQRLEKLGEDFLNDIEIKEIIPPIKQRILEEINTAQKMQLPAIKRSLFRTLLCTYLRRDEDIMNKKITRLNRTFTMLKITFNRGNLKSINHQLNHLDFKDCKLFQNSENPNTEVTQLFWRMIDIKLESYQFFGPVNHNLNFLDGLKSLALLYPLTLASAKIQQTYRNAENINAEDIDLGVEMIEHNFGRLDFFASGFTAKIPKLFMDKETFSQLVFSL